MADWIAGIGDAMQSTNQLFTNRAFVRISVADEKAERVRLLKYTSREKEMQINAQEVKKCVSNLLIKENKINKINILKQQQRQ